MKFTRKFKKDLTGLTFGKLKVVEYSHRKNDLVYWKCSCECGGSKEVPTFKLTGSRVRSCGCLLKTHYNDITGKKLNRLTAIKYHSKNSANNRIWIFKCDCGKEFKAEYSDFVREKVKSCGCLTIISAKSPKSKYSRPVNEKYNEYKFRAKKNGIKFDLSKDEFLSIIKSNCNYCGESPSQCKFDRTRNFTEMLNGIDKVDNDSGYIMENCVPCCTVCNLAKRNMGVDVFLDWISRVSDNLRTKGLI